mmetsp:Transcript_6719/g.13023  ORF Transcript_6719/g.13023 Transcript_6719/m.13023 type:complete len:329 (+) Transcript_6719:180-1166(+)
MEPVMKSVAKMKSSTSLKAKMALAKLKLGSNKIAILSQTKSSGENLHPSTPALTVAASSAATAPIATFNIIAAGAFGGASNCVMGHPLDTLKVIAQSSTGRNLTMYSMSKTLWREAGFGGFYRGLTPPLIASCTIGSAFWLISTAAKDYVREPGQTRDGLRLPQVVLASQMTAPFYSAVVCPIEVIKCRMQADAALTNPVKCAAKIVRTEGVRQLWAGLLPTYLRRMVGLPFFFVSHSVVKAETGSSLLGGFAAGTVYWAVAYPLDVIKTRMHSSTASQLETAKALFAESGVRGFYRGVSPALARAGPANAVYFVAFEWALSLLEGKN